MSKFLIATSAVPSDVAGATLIFALMRKSAAEGNLIIPPGIWWTHGPGCSNLAFEVQGNEEEANAFAKAMSMALMPSKWADTNDKLPDVDTCDLF